MIPMTTSPANASIAGVSLWTALFQTLLRELDREWPNPFSFDDLQTWPPYSPEAGQHLGLIRENESAKRILVAECTQQPVMEPDWVLEKVHGTIGICGCGDDVTCDVLHYITEDRMRQWAVSFSGVAAAVARSIGAKQCEEVFPDRIAFLGGITRG